MTSIFAAAAVRFAQGLIADFVPGASVPIGLTDGLRLVFGSRGHAATASWVERSR